MNVNIGGGSVRDGLSWQITCQAGTSDGYPSSAAPLEKAEEFLRDLFVPYPCYTLGVEKKNYVTLRVSAS